MGAQAAHGDISDLIVLVSSTEEDIVVTSCIQKWTRNFSESTWLVSQSLGHKEDSSVTFLLGHDPVFKVSPRACISTKLPIMQATSPKPESKRLSLLEQLQTRAPESESMQATEVSVKFSRNLSSSILCLMIRAVPCATACTPSHWQVTNHLHVPGAESFLKS